MKFKICLCFSLLISTLAIEIGLAQQPALGRHYLIPEISDDFEDPNWNFNYDTNTPPTGRSNNLKWGASATRGAPLLISPTTSLPSGSAPGSTQALSLRDNGIHGGPFQKNFEHWNYSASDSLRGTPLSASDSPLVTAQMWLPNFDTWTDGVDNISLRTAAGSSAFTGAGMEIYPSIWLTEFADRVFLRVRAATTNSHQDFFVGELTQAGWYTFGIGYDGGDAFYYASPGTDDLTPADQIYSTTQLANSADITELRYHMFSSVYPGDGSLSPDFLIDNVNVQVAPEPSTAMLSSLIILISFLRRNRSL